jgi:hypothetical protein
MGPVLRGITDHRSVVKYKPPEATPAACFILTRRTREQINFESEPGVLGPESNGEMTTCFT